MAIEDILQRFWEDLIVRPSGPLALRFLLQPVMATLFGIRDGIKDARDGRSPYFWTVLSKPDERHARLIEGVRSTGKIMVLAVILDTVYQVMQLRTFYPFEAVVVAIVLAFVPYLLIRGPAARIARWWSSARLGPKS
ncbi:hypothetical protein [Mesorhizobium sp.]|uniref:hypothetical protein n=1 Tax=Mesorhizobium sp. TaxID=1871066 RepID=UPI001228AB6A|nr:hypothetical protein [Mesorhizobium sp.]TIO04496.1 MAG: hypothetical protein E5X88_31585 [Mesorhizobium sp.]TIO29297.1 MAG: hypothetical protein E5X89_31475 [Mesorhizobium sp.]TIP09891.1 MAG: hypothetical protein E5X73_24380 [Mesorhizobium sp.]